MARLLLYLWNKIGLQDKVKKWHPTLWVEYAIWPGVVSVCGTELEKFRNYVSNSYEAKISKKNFAPWTAISVT